MESVMLKLSQRLMLSMEPTDMVMDLDTVHTPLDMADTLVMDTDMGVDMDMGMDMDTTVKQSGIKSASVLRRDQTTTSVWSSADQENKSGSERRVTPAMTTSILSTTGIGSRESWLKY